VAISVDSPEESREFAANRSITVPLLSDPGMTVISAYGVAMEGDGIAVPAVFVVDRKGLVRWRLIGETMWNRPPAETLLEAASPLR